MTLKFTVTVKKYIFEFDKTLIDINWTKSIHIVWVWPDAAGGSVRELGALGHQSSWFHLQSDQQALLGGSGLWGVQEGVRVSIWVNGGVWDSGARLDDGGLRTVGLHWGHLSLWQVNVCVQGRTRIGWLVFTHLSEREGLILVEHKTSITWRERNFSFLQREIHCKRESFHFTRFIVTLQ